MPQRYLTFEQIVELSNEGIWILDEKLRVAYANPRAAEIVGATASDLVGVTVEDFLFPQSHVRYREILAELKAQGSARLAEAMFRRRDGQAIWCMASARTIHAPDGRFVGVFGVLSDVTEQRQAVEALRENEALFRESQRAARVGSYVFDIPADRWTSSEVLDEIFGIDGGYARDLAGWMSLVHADDRAMMAAYFENLLATRGRFDKQYRVRRPVDGDVRWVQGYGELRFDASGQPVRMFGAIQDITERRRQEEERRRLEARLLQGQKLESLGVLAGGVAHEFNNLLTSILGNVDLALQDLPVESPVREYVRNVETASRRAAEVSHQMLAYSGRGRFVVERADVSRIVQDMARMLEVSVPKGTELRFDLQDGLPPVEADAAQLRQMVLNLVLNAAEAIDPRRGGSVLVRSFTETCAEAPAVLDHFNEPVPAGDYVVLEVTDDGGGMDAPTLARIFEPFFSTKFTGRGLGLPAALGVVRGHHGYIQVKSQVGRGTTVRTLLPALSAGALRDRRAAASPAADAALVLVVDDEDSVRTLTVRLIERCGYRALGAADGVEALALLRARHAEFACVLLDLTMPRMGGEETLRELRVFAPLLPVLISSGYEGSELSRRLEALHVAGFIQKPYQLAGLKTTLDTVVRGHRGTDEITET